MIAGALQVLESVLRCDELGGDLPLHVAIVQDVLCTGVVIAGFILMLAGVPSVFAIALLHRNFGTCPYGHRPSARQCPLAHCLANASLHRNFGTYPSGHRPSARQCPLVEDRTMKRLYDELMGGQKGE